MKITLDENYNAKTDTTTLGYVGEINARIITFEGYQCEDADNYKMRFKYPDGVTYDVDISDGTYTIDGSILRRVGELHIQILACRHNGDTYDYVKKSNILTLQIGRSLNGGVSPVPTYEQSVEVLEKVFSAEKLSAENAQKSVTANNAAQAAQNAAEAAKETAEELVANAEKAAENAVQSETAAQIAADTATDKAAEISESAEQIQKNTADIAKLHSKSDGIVCESEGSAIVLTDSSELPFNGMRIFGRSEQFATTGAQLLNPDLYSAVNTYAGVTAHVNSDGSVTLTGTSTSTTNYAITYWLGEYIDVLEDGKTYIRNADISLQIIENGVPKYPTKITVNKSAMTSVKPYIQITVADYKNGMTIYPMLNEGDTAMPFEPYTGGIPSPNPDYPQEIVSVGDSGNIDVDVRGGNLFDAQKIVPNPGSDVSATAQGARLELINNTGGQYKSMYYAIDRDFSNIELTLSANITASGNADGCVSVRFYSNGTEINGYRSRLDLYNSGVKTKTAPAGTDRIRIFVYSSYQKNANVGDTVIYDNIMLNIGSAAFTYEPYKHQPVTLSTPNGLSGIPVDSGGNYTDENGQQWICDEIDLVRGVYVKRIHKQIFNGTENWEINDAGNGIKYFMLQGVKPNVPVTSIDMVGLCEKTKIVPHRILDTDGGYGIAYIYFWRCNFAECDANNGATVSDLKSFLSNNPMTIFYAGVSIETPLSAEEVSAYKSLHTHKPTTTIIISDSAHMAVSYTADTKTYIDNKFAELQAAIISTGGNV